MHPTRDITSAGRKIKLVSRHATYFEAQLLFDQQTVFLRPEAAKLMTQRASPSQFSWAHPFTGYSPTVWKSPPDYCNKDRQHHSTHSGSSTGLNGSKRRLSISWHWTTMQAHTEVHRQALQQLAELCLHHLSVQWQGGGTLLSGCFCQGKQRSLAASPISHTNRVLQTSALTMQHFSTLYMKRDLKQIENTILDWRQTYALSIPRLRQHSGSPHICKDTHSSQLSFLSPHHSLHRSLSFFAYNGCFKQLWLKGQFARGFLKGTAERLHLSDADMAAKHCVSEGAQLKMGWETVDLTATETR